MSPVNPAPISEKEKFQKAQVETKTQVAKGIFAIERRKSPRVSIEFPIDYSLIEGKTAFNGGMTADASEGGVLVYLPDVLGVGDLLKIEIFYVRGLSLETVKAIGKVVWCDLASKESFRENRYGLQFQSIDEGNFAKLKMLLKEVGETHG